MTSAMKDVMINISTESNHGSIWFGDTKSNRESGNIRLSSTMKKLNLKIESGREK